MWDTYQCSQFRGRWLYFLYFCRPYCRHPLCFSTTCRRGFGLCPSPAAQGSPARFCPATANLQRIERTIGVRQRLGRAEKMTQNFLSCRCYRSLRVLTMTSVGKVRKTSAAAVGLSFRAINFSRLTYFSVMHPRLRRAGLFPGGGGGLGKLFVI